MRIALFTALVVAVPVAAADRPPRLDSKSACQNPTAALVARRAPQGSVHPLSAEPPAKQVLTVMRTVDGCTKPVIVRDFVGAPARSRR